MSVLGTRPEAIKLAPLILDIASHSELRQVVVATAQHREILDQALGVFGIVPDVDLNAMGSASPPDLPFVMAPRIGSLIEEIRPDVVVVQGDTATAAAGGMAAAYRATPVAHVEAGLRTHDRAAPFPEEMNRQVISRLATLHFAPTSQARANLIAEGIAPSAIEVTGNTIVDALMAIGPHLAEAPGRARRANGSMPRSVAAVLDRAIQVAASEKYVLATTHRREHFGLPLRGICSGLLRVARSRDQVSVLVPVHPNPSVSDTVRSVLDGQPNVLLLPPLDYLSFLYFLSRSSVVVTDSGGVQEEAAVVGRRLVITRERTERPEVLATGRARLVGTDAAAIHAAVLELLDAPDDVCEASGLWQGLGDGRAAARITSRIRSSLGVATAGLAPIVPIRGAQ